LRCLFNKFSTGDGNTKIILISSLEKKKNQYRTNIVIVWSFQARLELSHLVDYRREIYSMNLIYRDKRKFVQ